MFEIPAPGLFVVRYRTASDLVPAAQAALVGAIRSASRLHAVAVVFVVGEAVSRIDFAVPAFWIKVVGDPTIRIGAMAVVTESRAVEIAARGFGAASRFRHAPVEVRTFLDERSATAWARGVAADGPAAHP